MEFRSPKECLLSLYQDKVKSDNEQIKQIEQTESGFSIQLPDGTNFELPAIQDTLDCFTDPINKIDTRIVTLNNQIVDLQNSILQVGQTANSCGCGGSVGFGSTGVPFFIGINTVTVYADSLSWRGWSYTSPNPFSEISGNLSVGIDFAITSAEYTIGPTTYPVRGYLYVPPISSTSVDVIVLYHGTISNTTTTVLEAASNFMGIAKDNIRLKDKIIFSVAYPQDAIPTANSLDGTYGGIGNAGFLFEDNLPFARAALLWAKNSLNSYMASQGLNKSINRVFMFGHSQGGSLVHKLNTLESTDGVIANAPGPIRLDLTCQNQESIGLVGAGKPITLQNAVCQKLYNVYGSAFTSSQYFDRSVQAYTTGLISPTLYIQGQQDTTGAGNQIDWINTLFADVESQVVSDGKGGLLKVQGGHDAFVNNPIAQQAIRDFVESTGSDVTMTAAGTVGLGTEDLVGQSLIGIYYGNVGVARTTLPICPGITTCDAYPSQIASLQAQITPLRSERNSLIGKVNYLKSERSKYEIRKYGFNRQKEELNADIASSNAVLNFLNDPANEEWL